MKVRHTFLLLGMLLCQPAMGEDSVLQLPLGDDSRREKVVTLGVDMILETTSGQELSPRQLAESLGDARIVLAGEEHTTMDFHRVQLTLIQALHEAGREVIVGLEMFPFEDQPILDDWIDGHFTEAGFIEQSNWYQRWGYHWGVLQRHFPVRSKKRAWNAGSQRAQGRHQQVSKGRP